MGRCYKPVISSTKGKRSLPITSLDFPGDIIIILFPLVPSESKLPSVQVYMASRKVEAMDAIPFSEAK